MTYEEAIGVGRAISPAQLAMVMHMDAWPPDRRRDYNVEELLWKDLITPSAETICGYALTDRGEAVREARRLKEVDDATLLRILKRTDGESAFAVRVLREIEDRRLDI
jgi:hypothetical protein